MKNSRDGSLKEYVYQDLYQDILNARIIPGQSLTEKELVEKFNISKSPIREALISLCNEGILRSIPRYGYEVVSISQEDMQRAKETRILIEQSALEAYFALIKKEDIDAMRRVLDENKGKEMDIIDHWDKNMRFHVALANCYGNKFITQYLEKVMTFMTRGYIQYQYAKRKHMSFTGESTIHSELVDAIDSGDKKNALLLLRKDIGTFEIV